MNRILDLRQQLQQLARLRTSGVISDADHDRDRSSLERELVDLVLADEGLKPSNPSLPWFLAGLGAAAVLAAAMWSPATGVRAQAQTNMPGTVSDATQAPLPQAPPDRARMAAMTQTLAQNLQRHPDNAPGWIMLARSHALLDQPQQASQAYAKALALSPDNPSWLAEYAQIQAALKGGPFGEPERAMVNKALALDPANLKALWLAGAMAFEQHDYDAAIRSWEKMLQIGPIEDLDVTRLQASIAEARKRGQLGLAALVNRASGAEP